MSGGRFGAETFVAAARQRGFAFYTGVPCSYLKPLINHVIDSPELRYVAAANEGDAVAMAAGSELGGQRAVVMFQNSGLGNAVNPLTSLTHTFELPLLLIVTLRGEPDGPPDEPQHAFMGAITKQLLDVMAIRWEVFPEAKPQVEPALDRALESMTSTKRPFAFVMRHGALANTTLRSQPVHRSSASQASCEALPAICSRQQMLATVQSRLRPTDVVIATTGYTGRELYACADLDCQFYMVGSMGCASSFGLGLAAALPHRRIVVLDGDGALLMRLSALATIGYERPPNLLHLVLDNQSHESTGGQATVSHSVDLCGIAASCGYPQVHAVNTPEDLAHILEDPHEWLRFVRVSIRPGLAASLPRPAITPPAVAERFRQFLARTSRAVPGRVESFCGHAT